MLPAEDHQVDAVRSRHVDKLPDLPLVHSAVGMHTCGALRTAVRIAQDRRASVVGRVVGALHRDAFGLVAKLARLECATHTG